MFFSWWRRDASDTSTSQSQPMKFFESQSLPSARTLCFIASMTAALSACGGGGGGSDSGSAAGYGSGSTSTSTSTTSSSNTAPTLDVETSIEVEENQTAVATVSASDSDGDNLSFSLSGEDADFFTIGDNGVLAFSSAPDYESKSSYSVTIEVSDGTTSTSRSVTVSILDIDETEPNNAPAFSGLDSTVQVNENQTSLLTLSASDADDDSLTFSIGGADSSDFSISDNGVITFVNAPDFEAKSSYSLTVTVSDGTDEVSQQITVQIIDVAEAVSEAPVEFNLVVVRGTNGYGTGDKYSINDNVTPNLELEAGKTYRFLLSDSSNRTHPVGFSTTANGTFGGGVEYTEGVSRVGSVGNSGAYVQITAPAGVTTLYYYCLNHSGMGGTITISASSSGAYVVPMN